MNAKEIMDNAIGYSTPELDKIKGEMVDVIEKMIAYVPTLKAQGMSELDICANVDTTLRRVFRKVLNGKEGYMVQRDGKTAIMGLGIITANYIVNSVKDEIKRAK